MSDGVLKFKIDGDDIVIDLREKLIIQNLEEERAEIASQIAFWGAVLAAADCEVEELDAALDNWSGRATDKVLASDPKLSEWKAKPIVRAQKSWLEQKKGLAQTRKIANKVRAVYTGYMKKHDMLKTLTEYPGRTPQGKKPQIGDGRFSGFRNRNKPTTKVK